MSVGAVLRFILTSFHQIEKTHNGSVQEFLVGVAALLVRKSALPYSVVVAGVHFQVVGGFAFATIGAIILIVEFFAGALVGLGAQNLPADVVREVAVHAILAVASEIVNAGILVAFNMDTPIFALGIVRLLDAFINCKVLVGTQPLDEGQLRLEFFILYEILVVHSTVQILLYWLLLFI